MLTELTIYAADSVLTARLLLVEDRVSDLLGGARPVDLRNVRITSLEDGHRMVLDSLVVDRREILLAVADSVRGRASRRVATVQRPVIAQVGPYRVVGQVHGPPSADPIELARRRPWIAITNATVAYSGAGMEVRIRHGAVLVNRDQLGTLVADDDGPADQPAAASDAPAVAARAEPAATQGARDAWPTEHGTSSAWR